MADIKFLTLAGLTKYDSELKTYIGKLLEAANGDITAVETLVNTLVGEDANKSVRTIANEELAAQLIPENAKEALDTLKEIAEWIQAHPDDVTAMNASIAANTKAVEDEAKRAGDAESALSGRLDVIEGEGAGSVKKAQADAEATAAEDATTKVNALKDTVVSANNGENQDITVTLGGTVGAPTVNVSHNFVAVTDAEILALFAEEQD